MVIHAAAQPSHDWAALDPHADHSVNATGTLVLLESVRQFAPGAVFIFTSTNKVYGDTPNRLPLEEQATRWEIAPSHPYAGGIDESMSIDGTQHSLFGASKAAADLLVQEYGRYFGMPTVCFRAGCLTGPQHSGAVQHGFLAYLLKCAETGMPYKVIGYLGQAGARQPALRRPGGGVLRIRQEPTPRRGLQHGRRTRQQLLGARSHRALRGQDRPADDLDV